MPRDGGLRTCSWARREQAKRCDPRLTTRGQVEAPSTPCRALCARWACQRLVVHPWAYKCDKAARERFIPSKTLRGRVARARDRAFMLRAHREVAAENASTHRRRRTFKVSRSIRPGRQQLRGLPKFVRLRRLIATERQLRMRWLYAAALHPGSSYDSTTAAVTTFEEIRRRGPRPHHGLDALRTRGSR